MTTDADRSHERTTRGVVLLLVAQAVAFGMTLALLLVPANSLFLDLPNYKFSRRINRNEF